MANNKRKKKSTPVSRITDSDKPKVTKKDWEKHLQKLAGNVKKNLRTSPDFHSLDQYEFGKQKLSRRIEVISSSMETIYSRYEQYLKNMKHHDELGEQWLTLNLETVRYDRLEHDYHILYAASLWILDHLYQANTEMEQYRYLPQDDAKLNEFYSLNNWDCHYDVSYVASVEYVLYHRNKPDDYVADFDKEEALLDSFSTPEADRPNTENRRNFEGLLSLLPQDSIQNAVEHFRALFWLWCDRYFSCMDVFNERLLIADETLHRQHEAFMERALQLQEEIDQEEQQWKLKKQWKGVSKKNPYQDIQDYKAKTSMTELDSTPVLPVSDLVKSAFGRLDDIISLDEEFNQLFDERDSIIHDQSFFQWLICNVGVTSDDLLLHFGPELRERFIDLPKFDPYEMCFALLLLIDQGDEIPWYYGACIGLMNEIGRSLPWGVLEYDELEDGIWFGEKQEPNPEIEQYLYEHRYYKKASEEEDETGSAFPRNLDQILYEATGCSLPRNITRCRDYSEYLEQYDFSEQERNLLGIMMNVFAVVRRQSTALNLDPNFMEDLDDLQYLFRHHKLPESGEYEIADCGLEEPENSEPDPTEAIRSLQAEVRHLRTALHDTEKAKLSVEKELHQEKESYALSQQELTDLRALIFQLQGIEKESETDLDGVDLLPYDILSSTLVFGGHPTWEKAIRPLFKGNIRFFGKDLHFDSNVIRHADVIWIQTNAISHSQYYRIVNEAKRYQVPVRYFQFASAKQCALQLIRSNSLS